MWSSGSKTSSALPSTTLRSAAASHQLHQGVERLRREHRVGADVRMVGARLVVDLEQRRHGHDGGGRFTRQTLLLQPLGQREREVSARGVAGQHDLFGVVALQPQPLVGVVAVVERLPDGVLRDHPVVDDQHRAVGELRQRLDQPAVASSRRRSETRRRACRATTRRLPSAGSTPAARTSCALQFGSAIVARTVPGAGRNTRHAKSTSPNGHGRRGA